MFVWREAGYEALTAQRADRRCDPAAINQNFQIAGTGLGAIDLKFHRTSNGAVGYVLYAYGSSTCRIAVYGSKARQRAVAVARPISRAMAIALRDHMLAGLLDGLDITAGLVRIRIVRV